METTIGGLLQVDFFEGDTVETVRYRRCDICYHNACTDIWDKKPLRTFYYDPAEGLNVCENCVAEYLEENEHGRTTHC